MKTTLPFLFLLLVSLSSLAQTKFEKGYYTTFEGDSVQAYIKNEDWNRNPEFIEVKNSLESSTTEKLTMQQVQRFRLEGGDLYETFVVDVDTSPTDINNLVLDAVPIIIRDTVMLRAVVKGPVNLYAYNDKQSKMHFYVSKGSEEPRELLYQKLKRTKDYKSVYITLPLYKGMLGFYLADCDEVKRRIDKTEFKQGQLSELVMAYNTCVNPAFAAVAPIEEKGEIRVGLVGGISAVSLEFETPEAFNGYYKDLVITDFKGQGVSAGLALHYTLPRAHGKWGIINELMLKQFAANGQYTSPTENFDTEFKMLYLGLNSMLRYSFNTGSIRPFINIGMANNMVISDNSYQYAEVRRYGQVSTKEGKPLEEIRNYEQAYFIGAGATKGKFAMEVRAEKGNGFSTYKFVKVTRTAYMLQLTYFVR